MSIRARLRGAVLRWLGIENHDALIQGLRRDQDACVVPLSNTMNRVEAVAQQLNRTTLGVDHLHHRLTHHERGPLLRSRKSWEAGIARRAKQQQALETLAAEPVEGEGPESADEMAVITDAIDENGAISDGAA